jgi:hypothetical protein
LERFWLSRMPLGNDWPYPPVMASGNFKGGWKAGLCFFLQ